MSLAGLLKGTGPNGFGYRTTAMQVTEGLNLQDQTILVTGCASGLGLETIRALGARGAHVIATARTVDRARGAYAGMPGQFTPLACDLAQPASIRACVAAVRAGIPPLDAIICNAGIMAPPTLRQAHGYELQFFTNHIGHFILVTGLLDRLTDTGRVVVVASNAHRRAPGGIEFDNLSGERDYAPMRMYGQSKLANVLFTRQLARRLPRAGAAAGRTANCLHPGVIATNLMRSVPVVGRLALNVATPLLLTTPEEGAATECYLATHPSVAAVTGQYFRDCNPAQPWPVARDDEAAARLWETSEAIVSKLTA